MTNFSCLMRSHIRAIWMVLMLLVVGTGIASAQDDRKSPDKMSKQELWSAFSSENLSDSSRVVHFSKLIWNYYLFTNTDSALVLANQGVDYARNAHYELKSRRRRSISNFFSLKGIAFSLKGNQQRAIDQFEQGIETLGKTDHESNFRATLLNNLGNVYSDQGDIPSAIDVYMESLHTKERLKDYHGVGNALNNLANLYTLLDDDEKAIKYFHEAQRNFKKVKDSAGIANTFTNLAVRMLARDEHDSCKIFLDSAINIQKKIGNNVGLIASYGTYSDLELARGQLNKAREYTEKSLKLNKQLDSQSGIAASYSALASIYLELGDLSQADLLADMAFEMASKLNNESTVNPIRKTQYKIEKRKGNKGKALEFYEQYITYRDSIKRDENKEQLTQRKYEYQYEKQKLKDSLERVEKNKLTQEKLKRQELEISQNRQRTLFLVVIVVVIIAFAIFILKRLKTSQRQRAIIERQKQEVQKQRNELDEKNREVMDSIQYAKRLQHAILPTAERFQQSVRSHFVYFNPKDVVSGDFFWLEQMGDAVYIAAADCTGHGVPGAMVSFVCSSALTKTVVEDGEQEPAEILNRTRDIVVKHFDRSSEGIYDGMDISLIKITPAGANESSDYKITFSGANNPLWQIRYQKLYEFKGDKQPVGRYDYAKPFTQQEIEGYNDDVLYLFSDGYVDQFGGSAVHKGGKKFKSKQLKHLLARIAHKPLEEQQSILEEEFLQWKNQLPQTDDVVVLGIRL
ncbi:MAG: tetratricopeptide repeat protein [Bacteroidota bacterium]